MVTELEPGCLAGCTGTGGTMAMNTQSSSRLKTFLFWLLALALPLSVVGFGLWCVLHRRALHLGRYHFGWVDGDAAIKEGWGFVAIGLYAVLRTLMSDSRRFRKFCLLFDILAVIGLALIVFFV